MIIGLSGKSGSGKDTMANFIGKHAKYQCWKCAIALPLKRLVGFMAGEKLERVDPLFINDCYDFPDNNKYLQEYGMTIRDLMIKVGRGIGSELGSLYFVSKSLKNVENQIHDPESIVIVPDVRFFREAEVIKRKGGVMVRIDAARYNKIDDATETEMDGYRHFDYHIQNLGTLPEFEQNILRMLDQFGWLLKNA